MGNAHATKFLNGHCPTLPMPPLFLMGITQVCPCPKILPVKQQDAIFKIMAGRINISICNVRKKYHSYNYHSVYSTKLLQQSKRITGNFTKSYEISRREAQRFYYENWKMMKIHLKNHSINRNPFSVLMREHYIENMERIMMNSGLSS